MPGGDGGGVCLRLCVQECMCVSLCEYVHGCTQMTRTGNFLKKSSCSGMQNPEQQNPFPWISLINSVHVIQSDCMQLSITI